MVQLAFYKANNGTWYDKLVAWWTRPNFWNFFKTGKYSHLEILFFECTCFSSSPRDGGTRWKNITNIRTSGHWDIVTFSDDKLLEKALISCCERQSGKKYDWLCIFLSNLIPLDEQDPKRWTCSEFVGRYIFHHEKSYRDTPDGLANLVGL